MKWKPLVWGCMALCLAAAMLTVGCKDGGHDNGGGGSSPEAARLQVAVDGSCEAKVANIKIYIDGTCVGTFQPGGSVSQTVSVGNHAIYATGDGVNPWGPITRYVGAGGHNEDLRCGQ